ncbi:MAG: hypothetical protein DWQ34_01920 [Planctomycetota bacterium]|nr:MAG: hypothetical protein DWQ29_18260 [Planctomycetota bacterium]REJ97568.1 MAG: hypothetical protein DWQ34_01920 [Planctomycetota bacterium]REK26905.1 MAG: hypothetical protein DWQ41_08690 [Planctomycetota bacterium]REK35394.1 MAG: hypothetical protein DWQ45_11805 [Planctomycetota bacterium]
MLFSWFRNRRRRKLRDAPFPAEWETIIEDNVRHVARLSEPERLQLESNVQVFVAEKNWEGVYGQEINDEVCVTVAAQACYLIVGLNIGWYDRVQSILIYPNAYSAPQQFTVSGSLVVEGRSHRLGEAWYRGPVVLSWPDVLSGGRREGRRSNLVFHEFAHELDMLNGGSADGTPPMHSPVDAERWKSVMTEEFSNLCRDCRSGQPSLLDCYGAENAAEFFAVATETFFQEPVRLRRRHPQLYETLSHFYRQDPATRLLPAT